MNKILVFILSIVLYASIISAQTVAQTINWPQGTLYCTFIGDPEGRCQWDNWYFIDANGASHSFQGATTQSGVMHPDGPMTNLHISTLNVGSTDDLYYLKATGENASVLVKAASYPKFQVLGVTYVPPGPGSYVDYQHSVSLGATNTIDKSFSYSINFGIDIGDSIGLDYAHTSSTSTEESTTKTNSYDILTKNAQNNFINHDEDLFDIWLNPQANITYSTANMATWDTSVNVIDRYVPPINGKDQMDHVVVKAGWLNGNIAWPPNDVLIRFQRVWDTSMPNPGLTVSDYSAILSLNPFARQIDPITGALLAPLPNSQIYSNVMLPAGNRYTLLRNINYTPVMQSITDIIANIQSSSITNSNENKLAVSHGWKAPILSGGEHWIWTHKASVKKSASNSDTASFTIISPDPSLPLPNASSVDVYQDNIYGTFMFVFPGSGF